MPEGLKRYAFGAGQTPPVLYVSVVCLSNTPLESYQYSTSFSRGPRVVNNGDMCQTIVFLEQTRTLTNLMPLACVVDSLCTRNQEANNVESRGGQNALGGQELRRTSAQVCHHRLGRQGLRAACAPFHSPGSHYLAYFRIFFFLLALRAAITAPVLLRF